MIYLQKVLFKTLFSISIYSAFNHVHLHSYFSLPLKEKLTLGNVEAVLKHVRERIENGGECSLKEINTLPLCQYLLNEQEIDQVHAIVEKPVFYSG